MQRLSALKILSGARSDNFCPGKYQRPNNNSVKLLDDKQKLHTTFSNGFEKPLNSIRGKMGGHILDFVNNYENACSS